MQHETASDEIKEIMCTVFGKSINEIDEESDVNSVDVWDSVNHLSLILAIEEKFGVALKTEEIGEMTSFGKILNRVKAGK